MAEAPMTPIYFEPSPKAVPVPVAVVPTFVAPPYDWKKTAKAAGKMALIAAAGVLVADESGLTSLLYQHVPPAYTGIGQVVIASVFAALRNWLINRKNYPGQPAKS